MIIRKGETIEGKVTGITKYGVFVEIDEKNSGMIHISEISSEFVKDINEVIKINQIVKALVIGANESGKLALSIKQLSKTKEIPAGEAGENEKEKYVKTQPNFEDMLNKFKRDSEEKISEIKFLEPKKSGQPRRKKD
ncbi:MAG: S1 RNA-binding domain-containing protein [Oscillospiraceae bacterium]|nr:S1 RNA-binding domain-containing protein [Oscillospiraceae bacterium]